MYHILERRLCSHCLGQFQVNSSLLIRIGWVYEIKSKSSKASSSATPRFNPKYQQLELVDKAILRQRLSKYKSYLAINDFRSLIIDVFDLGDTEADGLWISPALLGAQS